jgi:hypothetical protein
MSRRYTSSPPKRLHGVQWDCFSFKLLSLMWVSLRVHSYCHTFTLIVSFIMATDFVVQIS